MQIECKNRIRLTSFNPKNETKWHPKLRDFSQEVPSLYSSFTHFNAGRISVWSLGRNIEALRSKWEKFPATKQEGTLCAGYASMRVCTGILQQLNAESAKLNRPELCRLSKGWCARLSALPVTLPFDFFSCPCCSLHPTARLCAFLALIRKPGLTYDSQVFLGFGHLPQTHWIALRKTKIAILCYCRYVQAHLVMNNTCNKC
jgi:hypothetical protein